MSRDSPDVERPSSALIVVVTAFVALGDLITLLIFGVACATGENSPRVWLDFCDSPFVHLPALGIAVTIAAGIRARLVRNSRLFWVGAGFGVVSALALWVLWGDPAGNFPGIRTR